MNIHETTSDIVLGCLKLVGKEDDEKAMTDCYAFVYNIFRRKYLNGIEIKASDVTIIEGLRDGKTMNEIADALVLSPRTIEARIDSMKKMFGTKTRTELVLKALARGIVTMKQEDISVFI